MGRLLTEGWSEGVKDGGGFVVESVIVLDPSRLALGLYSVGLAPSSPSFSEAGAVEVLRGTFDVFSVRFPSSSPSFLEVSEVFEGCSGSGFLPLPGLGGILGDVPGRLMLAVTSYDPRLISECNDSTELVLGRMVV